MLTASRKKTSHHVDPDRLARLVASEKRRAQDESLRKDNATRRRREALQAKLEKKKKPRVSLHPQKDGATLVFHGLHVAPVSQVFWFVLTAVSLIGTPLSFLTGHWGWGIALGCILYCIPFFCFAATRPEYSRLLGFRKLFIYASRKGHFQIYRKDPDRPMFIGTTKELEFVLYPERRYPECYYGGRIYVFEHRHWLEPEINKLLPRDVAAIREFAEMVGIDDPHPGRWPDE